MTQAIVDISIKMYTLLLPIAWVGMGATVMVLLPLACFRASRSLAGAGIYYLSYLFGEQRGFSVRQPHYAWGWGGLIIGLLFFGVGVVPIGIMAAFLSLKLPSLGFSLIVMCIVAHSARVGGAALLDQVEGPECVVPKGARTEGCPP